jgi:hypothetical protein
VLSAVILNPEVAARYTFTCVVSEVGGVVGIWSLSFHNAPFAIIRGDGIASAKGCFGVPLIAPVPTTEPVLVFVKPIFFNRKSIFCSLVTAT